MSKSEEDQNGKSDIKRTGLQVLKEALEQFDKNHDEDVTIYSEIPERCKISLCYAGIDEAGRGPVLGNHKSYFSRDTCNSCNMI